MEQEKDSFRLRMERLKNGVNKLSKTYLQIGDLKQQLIELQPELEIQEKQANEQAK